MGAAACCGQPTLEWVLRCLLSAALWFFPWWPPLGLLHSATRRMASSIRALVATASQLQRGKPEGAGRDAGVCSRLGAGGWQCSAVGPADSQGAAALTLRLDIPLRGKPAAQCGLLPATNEPTPPAGGLHHNRVCCTRLEHGGAADGWAACAGQQAGWAVLVGCEVWAYLCMWAANPPHTAWHGRACRLPGVTWHPQDHCGSAHACCVRWYALLPFPSYTHFMAHAGDHPAQSRAAPPLTVPDISEARCAGLSAVCSS